LTLTQNGLQNSSGKSVSIPASSHAGQILDGYMKMLNSGDKNYVNQVTTLINSDNVHEIDATVISPSAVNLGSGIVSISEAKEKAINGEGIGTTTKYEFSGKLSNGLKSTNYTTVAHEVQHQFDFDQGNMKDAYDKDGNLIKGDANPAEQRAMKNEDFARDQEKLDRRRNY
jgi:hypothetical protein